MMSTSRVASRSRIPKPAKVVPIGSPESKSPADSALFDFEFQSEMTSNNLRGLRAVLDAWMVYERENDLSPDHRDDAFMFLGDAACTMGERLEAKRTAWHEARRAASAEHRA